MKPLGLIVDRLLIRFLAALALVFLGVLAAPPHGALADEKIQVAPPPPPSGEKQGEPAYDYKHEIQTVRRDRKPVLALLRAGDVVELQEYLPFGRGVNISRSGSAEVNVQTTRTDGTGKETTATVTGQGSTTIRTGREDAPVFMPAPLRQFLTRELVATKQFVVVERERILEIARELSLAKTAAVSPETAPRPGRLIGVHYIVEGSYFAAGGLPADDPALAPVRREIQKRRLNLDPAQACVMYLTVFKVETGEVKAVACGADLRPLVAVQRAVEDLLDQMREVVEPIRVARVNPETGMATLDIGSSDGVAPGTAFLIETTPAEGGPPQTVAAVAEKVDLLSSAVKLADPKAPVREGAAAKRAQPPPQGETPKTTEDKPTEQRIGETP